MDGIKDVAADILANKAGSRTYEFDRGGRHVLLATRYFPRFDWHLIVEQVEDDELGEIRSIMFTNLAMGLLATCLIIVIVVLAVNYFQGRLEYLATVDELTGVANRRQFIRELKNEMDRAARYGHSVSLLMIDVDRFKAINDNYGHSAGDKVLVTLAETMQSSLRVSDMLGRLGGEEFGAILPETDLDEAVIVADRVRAEVETRTLDTERGPFRVTVSLGAAAASAGSSEIEDLLQRADLAMYQAKERGRNQVCAAREHGGRYEDSADML
jgi:diguanylate cyclase (GGDEF)-like protein